MTPQYVYRAIVLPLEKQARLDGDTYAMSVDLGLHVHADWKIRLKDYSCVERKQAGGIEAQRVALALLYGAQEVIIQTHKERLSDRLSHDRWVADVWVDGAPLGELLLEAGVATHTPT